MTRGGEHGWNMWVMVGCLLLGKPLFETWTKVGTVALCEASSRATW